MQLSNSRFWKLSNESLRYIMKDAHEAAEAMKGHNAAAEAKYLEQLCDAGSVLYTRQKQAKSPAKKVELALAA
jgi:TRAP-type C4-dicarboxylate transport system substrate-binding protein